MAAQISSKYAPLTEDGAINLAKQLKLFPADAALACQEIGDGNLNLVFRITDLHGHTGVIIKQALPYAKVVGESWPLTLKRATIEGNALSIQARYVPDLVPKVYYTDEELAITIMEDLSHLQIARAGLIEGKSYPRLSEHIGVFMATTLFHTSDYGLNPQQKKLLAQQFINPELCKITEDLVFTDPFFDHETNAFPEELRPDAEALWQNEQLKLAAAQLKHQFLTEGEALLHGDLHTGSIFASDEETKVIDPEFAFYGPIGFDIGQFIANLLLNALSRKPDAREPLLAHVDNTWTVFARTFSELWKTANQEALAHTDGYRDYLLEKIWRDTVGFAGCEAIRRTIGLAHVKDLDGIADPAERLLAQRRALMLGKELMLQRRSFPHTQAVRELFERVLTATSH